MLSRDLPRFRFIRRAPLEIQCKSNKMDGWVDGWSMSAFATVSAMYLTTAWRFPTERPTKSKESQGHIGNNETEILKSAK